MLATGFWMPCCYVEDYDPEFMDWGFFDDEIHTSSVDDIDDIFTSDQWVDFYKMLRYRPEHAPSKCYYKCAANANGFKHFIQKPGTDTIKIIDHSPSGTVNK